jgi:hypothetical protein
LNNPVANLIKVKLKIPDIHNGPAMIANPNARGFCPWVASQRGHPKTHKFLKDQYGN